MIDTTDRRKRKVKLEISPNISNETVIKIMDISKKAHKLEMHGNEEIKTLRDLIRVYGIPMYGLRILHGEDWFYLYNNNDYNIEIYNMARIEPRFEDEHGDLIRELMEGFYHILDESIKDSYIIKDIKAELREDTSYLLYLYMLKSGVITQVGDDHRYRWKDKFDDTFITKEKQTVIFNDVKNILKNKDGITYMHSIAFVPSASYIAKKKSIDEKTNIEDVKAMI